MLRVRDHLRFVAAISLCVAALACDPDDEEPADSADNEGDTMSCEQRTYDGSLLQCIEFLSPAYCLEEDVVDECEPGFVIACEASTGITYWYNVENVNALEMACVESGGTVSYP